MKTVSKRLLCCAAIGMAVFAIGARPSACLGYTRASEATHYYDPYVADNNSGTYAASQPSPDILPTKAEPGEHLVVTQAVANMTRVYDRGKTDWTAVGGEVTFTGRSTDWGCFYRIQGVYEVQTSSTVGGGGRIWYSTFRDDGTARITLEVNGSGPEDDFVIHKKQGTLDVYLLGGSSTTYYTIALSAGSELKLSQTSVIVSGEGGSGNHATVGLEGLELGSPTISAQCQNATGANVTVQVVEFKIRDDDMYWNYSKMEMPNKANQGLLIGVHANNMAYLTLEGMQNSSILWQITFADTGENVLQGSFSSSNKVSIAAACGDADYTVKYVLDKNGNGQVDSSDSTIDTATWQVRIFSNAYRDLCISALKDQAYWADRDSNQALAPLLLYDFIDKHSYYRGGLTANVSTAAQDVRDSGLTHNCGADFSQPAGVASVPLYTFGETSPISHTVANSKDFVDLICLKVLKEHEDEVRSYYVGKENGTVHCFDEWQLNTSDITFAVGNDVDLFSAIYHATVNNIRVRATYTSSPVDATLVHIMVVADVVELYDFDYYSMFPADIAAAVQIGWGRGAVGGAAGRINQLLIHAKADETCCWPGDKYSYTVSR